MTRHPPEFQDTDPAAMKVWIDLLRKKTPGENLAAVQGLSGMAMELARAGERLAHPKADEREVFLRAASRWLDRDLMIQAYGWDAEAHGVSDCGRNRLEREIAEKLES
jgi:hypothetical protein